MICDKKRAGNKIPKNHCTQHDCIGTSPLGSKHWSPRIPKRSATLTSSRHLLHTCASSRYLSGKYEKPLVKNKMAKTKRKKKYANTVSVAIQENPHLAYFSDGRVQINQVGLRSFVARHRQRLAAKGSVHRLAHGTIELVALARLMLASLVDDFISLCLPAKAIPKS